MEIGDRFLLHKIPFPNQSQDVDEFLVITITDERHDVIDMWTGLPNCTGYKAVADNGEEFELNWNTFPSDSMTPHWMWLNRSKAEYWYDVVYVTHTSELYFEPVFIKEHDFIKFCGKHGRIYYDRGEGCFDCYMEREFGKERDTRRYWKGWL